MTAAGDDTTVLRESGDQADLTRSEERLRVGTETTEVGRVRVRKRVDSERVRETVERGVEHADVERAGVDETDTGEVITLPDGSVSVPVFEEVLVVSKKLVVRERVVIRKHTVYEDEVVETELRREEVDVDLDEGARGRVLDAPSGAAVPPAST